MPYKFLFVPLADSTLAEAELNSFIANHRVLAIERVWVANGSALGWGVCIEYLATSSQPGAQLAVARGKVDYKQVLTPAEFTVFAALRDLRKKLSQAEAVPPYTIFTNEQLAEMVRRRVDSKASLEEIIGVGNARIEKYGAGVLEVLLASRQGNHAADGQSV